MAMVMRGMPSGADFEDLLQHVAQRPQKATGMVPRGLSMGMRAAAAPASMPAPVAPIEAPWFKPVQPRYEDPNTGSMTYGPEAYNPANLANLLAPSLTAQGYQGSVLSGGGENGPAMSVSPDLQQWLSSSGLTIGGSPYADRAGNGGVSATLTDRDGTTVAQKNYATDDSDFFAAALAGLGGAFGLPWVLGNALGLGTGVVGGAVGGSLVGGGIAGLSGQDVGKGMLMGGLGGAASSYLGAPAAGGSPGGDGAFLGEAPWSPAPTYPTYPADFQTEVFSGAAAAPGPSQPIYPADTMTEVLQGQPAPASRVPGGGGAFLGEDTLQSLPSRAADSIAADAGGYTNTAPRTVNLGTFDNPAFSGGTMATAGGLQGATDLAAQKLRDIGLGGAPADALEAGGDALSKVRGWIKENPLLARGGAALVGSVLASTGALNPTSSAPGSTYTGPAKTWGSGLQIGIQPGAQPAWAPQPVTLAPGRVRPGTGLRMSGAGRYFGG